VRDLITSYASPVLGSKPLQLQPMERGLLLSNDLPGVTASGLLRPSPDQPGASDLAINVTSSRSPAASTSTTAAPSSPGSGRSAATWSGTRRCTYGDQLGLNVQSSPEPQQRIQGSARYQHPIGTDGLTGSGSITISRGAPAGIPGADLTTDSNGLWAQTQAIP